MERAYTTTLNAIREHSPCTGGWRKLLAHLGKTRADNAPLSLLTVLDSNGIEDAVWCLRALPEAASAQVRLFAVACARQVQHLMTDPRSLRALDVAEAFARGEATRVELDAAWAAAWAAWDAAGAAGAAWDAGEAAWAAWDAARAAGEAAWAAWDAARAAWDAAGAAGDAARAAGDAAERAAQAKQAEIFREMFDGKGELQ